MLVANKSDVFQLNVGGKIFSTTKATLCKYPQSLLALTANESVPSKQDNDGRHFIDRNGKLFKYVLEFFRTGKIVLPDDFKEFEGLCLEAEYYKLPVLLTALKEYKEARQLTLSTPSLQVMICWLLGSDSKNCNVCHFQVYCKSGRNGFKLQPDSTFGSKLTLQTFHSYLNKNEEWKLVKSETMTESCAAAFFLSMGFKEKPFKQELTYINVKIELWVNSVPR